jgi:hypothetical protein
MRVLLDKILVCVLGSEEPSPSSPLQATDGGASQTRGSDSPTGSQRQLHPDHSAGPLP